jgi:hypothetical protein
MTRITHTHNDNNTSLFSPPAKLGIPKTANNNPFPPPLLFPHLVLHPTYLPTCIMRSPWTKNQVS